MTYKQVYDGIKRGEYAPVYFLYGEEPFFIDRLADLLEEVVIEPGMRDFNQTVVYGRDATGKQIVDMAMRYPMMSDRQLVMVKEAHSVDRMEEMQAYFENPATHTVLVLCYKKKSPDKRKSFTKKLFSAALSFESKPLYENQVSPWIQDYVRDHGYQVDPSSAQLLTEYLGTNLSKVSNALEKVFVNLEEGSRITSDHIELYVGISKDYNVFELQNALSYGRVEEVYRIFNYFKANPKEHPIQMVIPVVASYFSKLLMLHSLSSKSEKAIQAALGLSSPRFAKDYLQAVRRYSLPRVCQIHDHLLRMDMMSKGYGSGEKSAENLMDELSMKLL